ncbi:hypothetical protein DERF_002481 [Dermatophagoides farinae]|uniref:Uncharacterized protein n=1 Tax=Dermatophagoides farinae TaxID=6954 RepID=A0A922ID64_DERFA|nr:hypothetical protein DERF_002481 [Dermatophagoides farinae]
MDQRLLATARFNRVGDESRRFPSARSDKNKLDDFRRKLLNENGFPLLVVLIIDAYQIDYCHYGDNGGGGCGCINDDGDVSTLSIIILIKQTSECFNTYDGPGFNIIGHVPCISVCMPINATPYLKMKCLQHVPAPLLSSTNPPTSSSISTTEFSRLFIN